MNSFLLLTALTLQQPTVAPAYWGSLTPGRFNVGFRQEWLIDSTRRLPLGKFHGPTYRPVLLNVWYPTAARRGRRMLYRDYFEGAERAAVRIPDLREYARELVHYQQDIVREELSRYAPGSVLPGSALTSFFNTPTAAMRDAPRAMGEFPLIVYFQGARSTYDDNVVLCEYLASKGYVVVGSAYPAEDNQTLATNVLDRSRERDARRMLLELRRQPAFARATVTLVGHSAGAHEALRFSADPSAPVDAAILLDTTQDYWPLTDRRWSHFTDAVMARSFAMELPLMFVAGTHAIFELADSLRSARRTLVTIAGFEHADFISQGIIARELATADRAGDARRTYDALVRGISDWLETSTWVGPHGNSIRVQNLLPGLMFATDSSPRALRHMVSDGRERDAANVILALRQRDPGHASTRLEVAVALTSALARQSDPDRARRFYAVLSAGDSAYKRVLHYFKTLGRYSEVVRDPAQADYWWSLAATVDPLDSLSAAKKPRP